MIFLIEKLARLAFGVAVGGTFLVAAGMGAHNVPVVRLGMTVLLIVGAFALVLGALAKLLEVFER